MGTVKVEKICYKGWENCFKLSDERVELIVTTDVGPRILSFCFKGEDNVFYENESQKGLVGGDEWRNYGGHRLWHSPQEKFRPNQPDNSPVKFKLAENGISLFQGVEEATGIEKSLAIELDSMNSCVKITHKMTNKNMWPIQFSAWALTMMAPGGLEILPIPSNDTFYMPNYCISLWPWTKLNDRRFTMGEKFMFLRQDPSITEWFKIGYENHSGWGGYLYNNTVFVKHSPIIKGQTYPDYGVNFETYTDGDFLELESLSPLYTVAPDESIIHEELWELHRCKSIPDSEEGWNNYFNEILKRDTL